MTHLVLFLFGSPHIEYNNLHIQVDTRKAIALIAYLAVTQQRYRRDTLATLLWPDYDQTHARATLRRTLSALHKALGRQWLHTDRETIALDPQADLWLDIHEFRSALRATNQHAHTSLEACSHCLSLLKDAVELYHDDFMAGFNLQDSSNFEDWQSFQADSLRHDLAYMLEKLIHGYSLLGDLNTALAYARRFLTLDRSHEQAHYYLMQLYAQSGQRMAALQQYELCVELLQQELGIQPSTRITQLYTLIKSNTYTLSLSSIHLSTPSLPTHEAVNTPSLHEIPFVGHEQELYNMIAQYSAIQSKGHVFVISGEAGIGKTRLTEEFLSFARSRGAYILNTSCYEGEENLAYGPISNLLRSTHIASFSSALPAHVLTEVARLLPEIHTHYPQIQQPSALDDPASQNLFFEGLRQFFLYHQPTTTSAPAQIICIDDLHWADSSSLDFIAYILRRLRECPVCLILTWRSSYIPTNQHLPGLLTQLEHQQQAQRIALQRLNKEAVLHLIEGSSFKDMITMQVRERLFQETSGIPFFITAYLHAIGNRVLNIDEETWTLPSDLRDLLFTYVSSLSQAARTLLNTAATIGRAFPFTMLCAVGSFREDEAISALEELIFRGIIYELPGPQTSFPLYGQAPLYDFHHEKLRSLVYSEINYERRRFFHRRVADVLIDQTHDRQDKGFYAAQIAHHLQMASNHALSASYHIEAGAYAQSIYAHSAAISHFSLAISLNSPDTAHLHEVLGDLYMIQGEYASAIKHYFAASALFETGTTAIIAQKVGRAYERKGEWSAAEEYFTRALLLFQQQLHTPTELARVFADRSLAAYHQGDTQNAHVFAKQAMLLARQTSDPYALAQAHNMLGILAHNSQNVTEALHHLEQSLTLTGHMPDATIHAAALNNLALVYKTSGNSARAIELFSTALALCASQGERHREAALHNNLADIFYSTGEVETAMSHLKQAVTIYAEIGIEAGTIQPEIWKLAEW